MNIQEFKEAKKLDEKLDDLHKFWQSFTGKPMQVYVGFFDDIKELGHIDLEYDEEFIKDLKEATKKLVVKTQNRMKELGIKF
jgi:hypothetical protein